MYLAGVAIGAIVALIVSQNYDGENHMSTSNLDRRNFLKSTGLVAAGFAAGSLFMLKPDKAPDSPSPSDPPKQKLPKGNLTMSQLSQSHFDACVGQKFTIEHGGVSHAATLVTVDGKSDGKVESFSLVFEVSGSEVFPQSMYKVNHTGIGPHEYFLVPVGNDGKATRYEAVFTRLIGKGEDDV